MYTVRHFDIQHSPMLTIFQCKKVCPRLRAGSVARSRNLRQTFLTNSVNTYLWCRYHEEEEEVALTFYPNVPHFKSMKPSFNFAISALLSRNGSDFPRRDTPIDITLGKFKRAFVIASRVAATSLERVFKPKSRPSFKKPSTRSSAAAARAH